MRGMRMLLFFLVVLCACVTKKQHCVHQLLGIICPKLAAFQLVGRNFHRLKGMLKSWRNCVTVRGMSASAGASATVRPSIGVNDGSCTLKEPRFRFWIARITSIDFSIIAEVSGANLG
jgi:hypothetical protein